MKIKLKKTLKIALIAAMSMITVFSAVVMAKEPVRDAVIKTITNKPDVSDKETAPAEYVEFVLPSGEKVMLTPAEPPLSLSCPEKYDIFTDEAGNEYLFTKDGRLKSVNYDTSIIDETDDNVELQSYLSGTCITEEELIQIALDRATDLFGSRADGFVVKNIYDYGISFREFSVMFTRRHGKDGFVEADLLSCRVGYGGTVFFCLISDHEEFADFDESVLEGLTKEDIEAFFKEKALAEHPTAIDFKIELISLAVENGEIAIKVDGVCICPVDFSTIPEDQAEVMKRSGVTTQAESLHLIYELN